MDIKRSFSPCIVMECGKFNLNEFNKAKNGSWRYEECLEIFKNLELIVKNMSL